MSIEKVIHLRDDEELVAVYRKYGLMLVPKAVLAAIIFVLPFFLMFPLLSFGFWGALILLVFFIVGIGWAAKLLYTWYFTFFAVTSDRLIDIFQKGFFDRTVAGSDYPSIQDVSYQRKGIIGTLLHVGTVTIQTSGFGKNIKVASIKDPHELVEIINKAREENKRKLPFVTKKLGRVLEEMDESEASEVLREVDKKKKEKAFKNFFN
ncbi:MAG: PH domain-containing protein [bacterium]